MKATPLVIPDVLLLESKLFSDARGFFFESFNQIDFEAAVCNPVSFVQDNHSRSLKGVLRGLHYQIQKPQGKLVRVVRGAVYDVAVDMRRSSPTFGHWVGVELNEASNRQIWIPPGFAHGFQATSESAEVIYKTTDYYALQYERCLAWDDPSVAINWPNSAPLLSEKDKHGKLLSEAETYT
jgi:dTDP-4-dehydrorhamnose 3,5-epimerase